MKLSALTGEAFDPDPDITGLATDSRAVKPGDLFAALPGVKIDGSIFAAQAVEMGAAAILSGKGVEGFGAPVIVDENPRRRLAEIAARFFPRQPEIGRAHV